MPLEAPNSCLKSPTLPHGCSILRNIQPAETERWSGAGYRLQRSEGPRGGVRISGAPPGPLYGRAMRNTGSRSTPTPTPWNAASGCFPVFWQWQLSLHTSDENDPASTKHTSAQSRLQRGGCMKINVACSTNVVLLLLYTSGQTCRRQDMTCVPHAAPKPDSHTHHAWGRVPVL